MWQLKKYKRSVYDDSILHHKKQNNLTHYKSRDCSYAVIRNISANKACSVQTISRKRRAAALTQVPPFLRLRLRELTAVGSGAPSWSAAVFTCTTRDGAKVMALIFFGKFV
jgi:hypothetical protein